MRNSLKEAPTSGGSIDREGNMIVGSGEAHGGFSTFATLTIRLPIRINNWPKRQDAILEKR